MKKSFFCIILLMSFVSVVMSQQPQSPLSPISDLKAKYTQGGYDPTFGTGLILKLGGGTVICNGVPTYYVAGSLTMTASATNYVYLNTSSSCVPSVKTTAFTHADIPIAIVVTNSNAIIPATGITVLTNAPSTTASIINYSGSVTPSGLLNNSNTTFTLPSTPSPATSLALFYNGILLQQGNDYTISGTNITMSFAPISSGILVAYYFY